LQKEQFILIAMETEKKELDSEALGFKEVLAEVNASASAEGALQGN